MRRSSIAQGECGNLTFYGSVGFARSSDNGKTWPAPEIGALGGPSRHPILQSPEPQPTVPHGYLGDAIPSGFVDKSASGDYYLYVAYAYFSSSGGRSVRVARAKLGADPLTFLKWYNGSFSQPGIGGLDSAVTPSPGCASTEADNPEISYNDDLGLYLMIFMCDSGPAGAEVGGWYYSTATSLDLEDWTAPQLIQNSQYPLTSALPRQNDGPGLRRLLSFDDLARRCLGTHQIDRVHFFHSYYMRPGSAAIHVANFYHRG